MKYLLALLSILFLVLAFSFGTAYEQNTEANPLREALKVQTDTLTSQSAKLGNDIRELALTLNLAYARERELKNKVSELENLPIITKEVRTTVYRNIYPRQWESIQQFTDWYNTQGFTILVSNGTNNNDCDDYADWVQDAAAEQGYKISIALTWNGRYYNGQYVTDKFTTSTPGHAGSMVDIAGTYYYFDPNPAYFNGLMKIVERD